MPKIIDDLNHTILNEAKKQVFENGYKNMTIRSVAKACKIASGTIYNYYKSKESLVAAFVLEDWIPLQNRLIDECKKCKDVESACCAIYKGLMEFEEGYQPLFAQDEAIQTASVAMPRQHPKLRNHLALLLTDLCNQTTIKDQKVKAFLPEFLAENLLAWSSEGKAYEDLKPIIQLIVH